MSKVDSNGGKIITEILGNYVLSNRLSDWLEGRPVVPKQNIEKAASMCIAMVDAWCCEKFGLLSMEKGFYFSSTYYNPHQFSKTYRTPFFKAGFKAGFKAILFRRWVFDSEKSTGCLKKNETPCSLNISVTKYLISNRFFSPENWDPCKNLE